MRSRRAERYAMRALSARAAQRVLIRYTRQRARLADVAIPLHVILFFTSLAEQRLYILRYVAMPSCLRRRGAMAKVMPARYVMR